MARAFADITFTNSVKAAQSLYGSRESNRGFELAEDPRNSLGPAEAGFIEARDSFYQATVGEQGWPYVQHRGGPVGFVKVVDARTMGYADFRGNRQYISVGNINGDERISLIFMDYANQRRIKIWGRAKVVHESENPQLIAQLEDAHYRARIERAVIIHVEAYEWNCPQHITPRFTEAEVREVIQQFEVERAALQAQVNQTTAAQLPRELGNGDLSLVITGIRQLTPRIRAYELRDPEGRDLPKVCAGSHLRVPVLMDDGTTEWRSYSISSNPARLDIYEIAVLREENGRGGSKKIHEQYQLGLRVYCHSPRNDFTQSEFKKPALLIAGGVGITAIKPIVQSLVAKHIACELHYAGRSKKELAYRDRLQRTLGQDFYGYYADENQQLDVAELLKRSKSDCEIFVCGPQKLIDAVYAEAQKLNIDVARIHSERFGLEKYASDQNFIVEVQGRPELIAVSRDASLLEALEDAGMPINSECRVGNCGQCVVTVVEGSVEHRDNVLTAEERASGKMCACVSRATNEKLVISI